MELMDDVERSRKEARGKKGGREGEIFEGGGKEGGRRRILKESV